MNADASTWLIKSSGRIIGPYTPEEVRELLRSNDITVIDEVCSPLRRWQLLRDHPAFQDMLDELRQRTYGLDDSTTRLQGFTASMTETLTTGEDNEITADIMDFKTALKEIVLDNVPESAKAPSPITPPARFQSAGDSAEQEVRRAAERGTRGLWLVTAIILTVIVSLLIARRVMVTNSADNEKDVDPLKAGLVNYGIGNYPKAMEFLKTAYLAHPDQREVWMPLALLSIHLDGQTVEATHLIQKAMEAKSQPTAEILTAKGLAEIVDGNLTEAGKTLDQAIAIDPSYWPAKANRGVVLLMSKDYAGASVQLKEVIDQGHPDGAVTLQLAASEVLRWKAGDEKGSLKSVADDIQRALKASFKYRQELTLAQLYLRFLSGEKSGPALEAEFRKIIDIDPDLTENHVQSLIMARQMSDWTGIGQWCRQLVESVGESATAQTLAAICLMRQGQSMAAKTAMQRAVTQAPKDALLQAVYSAVLKSAGYVGEASAALGRATELDRRGEYLLPSLLQARFCAEGGDIDCAKAQWMRVLQLEPNLPAAKVGLAQVYESMGSKGERDRLLREVGEIDPEFKPYLQMTARLKASPK